MSRQKSATCLALVAIAVLSVVWSVGNGQQPAAVRPGVAGKPVNGLPSSENPGSSARKEAEARILRALETSTSLEFENTPLKQVVKTLQDRHQVPMFLDKRALDDAGVQVDTPITCGMKGVRLQSGLDRMLRHLDLTAIVDDGILLITTQDEAAQRLCMRVYDVSDILEHDRLVRFRLGDSEATWNYDQLIEMLLKTVASTTWEEVGGPGTVRELHGLLVISQTFEVHAEIAELLELLREGRKSQSPAPEPPIKAARNGGSGMTVKKYEVLLRYKSLIPPPVKPEVAAPGDKRDAVKLQAAALEKTLEEARLANHFPVVQDLARAIPTLIAPDSWKTAGGQGSIEALPAYAGSVGLENGVTGVLLVRQRPEVHLEIQRLLDKLPPFQGMRASCF